MFTNDDTRHVIDAVTAGLSANIVTGLSAERNYPMLDLTLAHSQHEQALLQTLFSTSSEHESLCATKWPVQGLPCAEKTPPHYGRPVWPDTWWPLLNFDRAIDTDFF